MEPLSKKVMLSLLLAASLLGTVACGESSDKENDRSHCGSYSSFGIAELAWSILKNYSLP